MKQIIIRTSTGIVASAVLFISSIDVCAASESWSVDTQKEWTESVLLQEGLEIEDGMASPTAEKASLQSVLKRFSEKRSATSITFEQSPVWKNWNPVEDIGTASMRNAPVLLSLGPDNYWMFALYKGSKKSKKGKKAGKAAKAFKSTAATLEGFDIPLQTSQVANEFHAPGGLKKSLGGYHAWQSRDMKNWVHHGPITEGFSRWMTTAEYADGKAYFYYDFPNDQDPHVYVDEDMTDGLPGKNMGMAFKDPTHGSDCAFIRDLDGNFHVIAEDWSPINARTHAWDSPLATHAVSPDGITDFKILAPPVDHRTKPTGEIGNYTHPSWKKEDPANYKTSVAEYEIHEPEQNAYGDWAAISIGGQYYLFGDFDPAGHSGSESMSVAWFTSSSINEPFTFCGNIGKGHPDPDVMFALGQFYLVSQTDDFVSPGPWVESVELRVGVDVSNDGKIDEWTDWQTVKETYGPIPGFAKQVAKTPATLDIRELSAGYGFQFKLRVTDITENKSKPILDRVELFFED